MKTNIFIVTLFSIFFILPCSVFAAEYAEGEVLVKFKKGASAELVESIINAHSMSTHSTIKSLSVYRLKLPSGSTVEEMVEILSGNPDVEYAEPNYIRHISKTLNDLDANQWGLQNTGQTLTCSSCSGNATGTSGKDIDAINGWDKHVGSDSIIIAIIDTGVDLDHPDLNGKIVTGKDFVNTDDTPEDDNGHGTHLAGIAAAETDNGTGIAGVCWGCKIMPLKAFDSAGFGSDSNIISAIEYAVDNNADIINMSFGGSPQSSALEDAIKLAYNNNIISICAAGNENAEVSYPAAYDDYCIGVAATDNRDERASFSNFGSEVDVGAPGVDIYSTAIDPSVCKACTDFPNICTDFPLLCSPYTTRTGCADFCACNDSNSYGFCSGTSMAAPFVAGLAGIIRSQFPAYSVDEVTFRIMQTAEDINSSTNSGFDNFIGAGRIKVQPTKIETVSTSVDDDSGPCFISNLKFR